MARRRSIPASRDASGAQAGVVLRGGSGLQGGSGPNRFRACGWLERGAHEPAIPLPGAGRLPELRTGSVEYGVGYRPSLPDAKPVIDRSRRLANVYLAFGHGQLGLILAAGTGRLIADLVAGRPPGQDPRPFRANRFALLGAAERP
ncbi:FAD-dependent oxidoreductase [Pseudomonas stutzeri]|nr:FAD-dependent oxidoreductase [Stutzerimonas stutzeri]